MYLQRVVAAFALLISPAALAVDWSDPQSLVATAQANDPALARLRAELTSARERIAPAAARPNPMVMGGVQNKMVNLSDDEMMTMYMVGASQTFVWGDKRDARRTAAELIATAAELQIASTQVEVERDALFAWYDVAALDEQIAITERVRQLIDGIVDSARVRYEVGSAAQSDVIRGQLEKSALDHQMIALRGSRRAAAARLLATAGLPLDTIVPPIQIPRGTAQLEIGPTTAVATTHAAIAALQAEVNAQEQQIRLARLERKPDVNVEAQYGVRRTQRDMFSVVATVELPLWKDQTIAPRVREAIAIRDAAQRRIDELRRALARDLSVAAAEHATANQQIQFHEQVLVPQARLALDSTLAAYQTGRSSLDAVLGAESTYLRLQLDYANYLAAHIKAVREFEALMKGARAGALGGTASPTAASQNGGM